MPKITVFCTIVGRNTIFPVNIQTSRTVSHLKDEIKVTLANYEAETPTLYGGAIQETPDREERDKILSRLSHNLSECRLLVEEDLISKHFDDDPPEGLEYYVIVVMPEDERPAPKHIYVNGPSDPTLSRGFPLANSPLAVYSDYWGKGKNKVVENTSEFRPNSPWLPPLYVFEQYVYMRDRIDRFRTRDQTSIYPPGVAIVGMPGIGKTSFLDYYLACELSQSKHAVYYKGGICYFFIGNSNTNTCRVYAAPEVPHFGDGFHKILCLIDGDTSSPAPAHLLQNSCLFLVMAASPKKAHGWMKRRANGQNGHFVLNPPVEDELLRALRISNHVNATTADAEILRAVRSYGPNIRTLVRVLRGPEHEESVKDAISMTAKALSPSALREIIALQTETFNEISHTMLKSVCLKQPQVDDKGYDVNDLLEVTVAGPVVWRALVAAHKAVAYVELVHMLEIFAKIPQARGSGGWLWEHWIHAKMMEGGEFTLQQIYCHLPMKETRQTVLVDQKEAISTTVQISIPPLTPLFFNDDQDTSRDTSTYFLPTKTTHAGFDAFLFHHDQGIGFQITIASTHSLNDDGLKSLRKRLLCPDNKEGTPWFVAIIPKGQHFQYMPAPGTNDLQQFHFYKLEIALPDGAPPEAFTMANQPVDSGTTGQLEDSEMTKEPGDCEMLGDEN